MRSNRRERPPAYPIATFVAKFREKGGVLHIEGARIRPEAPPEVMTDRVFEYLNQNEAEIVTWLYEHPEPGAEMTLCERCGKRPAAFPTVPHPAWCHDCYHGARAWWNGVPTMAHEASEAFRRAHLERALGVMWDKPVPPELKAFERLVARAKAGEIWGVFDLNDHTHITDPCLAVMHRFNTCYAVLCGYRQARIWRALMPERLAELYALREIIEGGGERRDASCDHRERVPGVSGVGEGPGVDRKAGRKRHRQDSPDLPADSKPDRPASRRNQAAPKAVPGDVLPEVHTETGGGTA